MDETEGNTPLDEDEAVGLIPTHLTTIGQLNSWEQANITEALGWLANRRSVAPVLSVDFLMELHKKMFGSTWNWAGRFRTSAKNIGVDASRIPEDLANLLADTQYGLDNKAFSIDEVAARFHHRLVSIHPFPNGNGRHARLVTDELLESVGEARFSWGSGNLDQIGDARSRHLSALKEADKGELSGLLRFVRS